MPTQIDTTTASGDATAAPSAQLIIAAPSDATLNAVYFGSSGPKLATALSPYSSWSTQGIGSATTRNSQAIAPHTANDNFDAWVTSPGNGPYQAIMTRSGNAWSINMPGPVDAGGYEASTSSNGVGGWEGIDPQGRLWAVGIDDVNATYQVWCDYYNGSVWTSGGAAIEGLNLGEQNRRGIAACIVGGYLVIVYDSGSGGLHYLRLDVSGASLGAWSAGAAVTGVSGISAASTLSMRAIAGGSSAMLAYSDSGGIKVLAYDAGADTWGSITTLSSATSDRHSCLIAGGSGVVYAVWCQFASANTYALVGEAYSGGAWSGSVTTLETSVNAGTNAAWPNGTYLSGAGKLALIWTTATASPWAIQFDAVSAPPTSSHQTHTSSGALIQVKVHNTHASSGALVQVKTHPQHTSAGALVQVSQHTLHTSSGAVIQLQKHLLHTSSGALVQVVTHNTHKSSGALVQVKTHNSHQSTGALVQVTAHKQHVSSGAIIMVSTGTPTLPSFVATYPALRARGGKTALRAHLLIAS